MSDATLIVGTCSGMCPDTEVKWREENKLLHKFEILNGTESNPKADRSKVVKQFSRSAAGKSQQSASDLRPSDVLLKTMAYLTNEILPIEYVPWNEVYDFVNDRIQAIRQDITIQMIQDANIVEIYEKSARFYIISSYKLCEEPQSKFDQHLNRKQLTICLEKVIELYQKFSSEAMSEFVSVYISLTVNDSEKLYRNVILFKNFLENDLIKLTFKTCISYSEGNYIKFFLCIQKLPFILQIRFFPNFATVRKRALKALSVGFSSANCQLPLEKLSSWLCLQTFETVNICCLCGVKIEAGKVLFNKKDFNAEAPIHELNKEYLIHHEKIDVSSCINSFRNLKI